MKGSTIIALSAHRDITSIREYIARDNPAAADKVATAIYDGIGLIAENPQAGVSLAAKFDLDTSLRCKVIRNLYLVFYTDAAGTIYVVRVIDGRRDYLRVLGLK